MEAVRSTLAPVGRRRSSTSVAPPPPAADPDTPADSPESPARMPFPKAAVVAASAARDKRSARGALGWVLLEVGLPVPQKELDDGAASARGERRTRDVPLGAIEGGGAGPLHTPAPPNTPGDCSLPSPCDGAVPYGGDATVCSPKEDEELATLTSEDGVADMRTCSNASQHSSSSSDATASDDAGGWGSPPTRGAAGARSASAATTATTATALSKHGATNARGAALPTWSPAGTLAATTPVSAARRGVNPLASLMGAEQASDHSFGTGDDASWVQRTSPQLPPLESDVEPSPAAKLRRSGAANPAVPARITGRPPPAAPPALSTPATGRPPLATPASSARDRDAI